MPRSTRTPYALAPGASSAARATTTVVTVMASSATGSALADVFTVTAVAVGAAITVRARNPSAQSRVQVVPAFHPPWIVIPAARSSSASASR